MGSGFETLVGRMRRMLTPAMLKWWLVGVSFIGVNIALLYLLVDLLGLKVWLATLVAGEIGTVLRFLVNDRWVFGHRRPTWQRLWQYHVATAGGAAIWIGATNLFTHFGVHYALASVLAMMCSVLVSLATNFLWIWKRR